MTDEAAPEDVKDRAALELVLEAVSRRPQVMRATGQSMEPAIPSGSRVELSPVTDLRLGDVVAAFFPSGDFVIHRVVGLDARGAVLLKPDNLPWIDGWTTADLVRAQVTRVERDGTWTPLERGVGATVLAPYERLSLRRILFDRVRRRLGRRG